MATFEELMEQFRTPAEGAEPPSIDELATAHQDELSAADAAVKAREAEIARLADEKAKADAEVLRVKAVNYDLMRSAPIPGEPGEQSKQENSGGEKTDRPRGIAALFE